MRAKERREGDEGRREGKGQVKYILYPFPSRLTLTKEGEINRETQGRERA